VVGSEGLGLPMYMYIYLDKWRGSH